MSADGDACRLFGERHEDLGQAVAILNHNKPTAYLVPAKTYEMIMEKLEDYQLSKVIEENECPAPESLLLSPRGAFIVIFY